MDTAAQEVTIYGMLYNDFVNLHTGDWQRAGCHKDSEHFIDLLKTPDATLIHYFKWLEHRNFYKIISRYV